MADSSSSCSHWFHAPFYLITAIALAFISLTTMKHTSPANPPPPSQALAINASRALILHGGYRITASLLQISPELFFSGKESSTVFAIHDSAISNLSIPAPEMRRLLRYHTAESSLAMADLVKKPLGSCVSTNLVITERNPRIGSIAINNVPISDPDLFLQGPLSVHGVLQPFDEIPPPPCLPPATNNTSDRRIQWRRVVRFLSSKGFVSFAIGLNAVIDGILADYRNLTSATIFAPPDSQFASSSSSILSKIVRIHILPQRFTQSELLIAENSSLTTLVPEYKLKIQRFSRTVMINDAELSFPDMFSHNNFVIHGISQDFASDFLPTSYRYCTSHFS